MFGRVTASQIASASAASFFCRLTYGFTYAGGSGAPCGRAPEVHATNDVTTHTPRCRRGTVAISGRTPAHSGASIAGEEPLYHPHRRRGLEKLTLRYRDRLS